MSVICADIGYKIYICPHDVNNVIGVWLKFVVFSRMTIVNTMATVKDDRIYVRVSSDIKQDFELVAAYRGLTPSAMLHSFMVKTIHEAREKTPQIFQRAGETENKVSESENLDRVMTLNEAKADDNNKKDKKN